MSEENKVVRILEGRVVGVEREKTCKVIVHWSRRHPIYGKVEKKRTTYHVHDADNSTKVGDLVSFKQVKPISKTKTWALVQILERTETV